MSAASAAEIRQFYRIPAERIQVVPHGSELSISQPIAPNAVSTAYVLVVASASKRKNVETALQAVELVRAAGQEIECVVVGALPASLMAGRPWLRAQYGVPDRLLAELYAGASAVILPSRHEGFGLPAVEALAFGTPVVASDIPALREVTRGQVRYADPQDSAAFARELLAMLADPQAERQRIAGVVAFARSLTWAAAVDHTVDVYRTVLTSGTRGRAWLPVSTVASPEE